MTLPQLLAHYALTQPRWAKVWIVSAKQRKTRTRHTVKRVQVARWIDKRLNQVPF